MNLRVPLLAFVAMLAVLPARADVFNNTSPGFQTADRVVLHKGERDAGTVVLVTMYRDENARLFERMPQLDGSRIFTETKKENPENKQEFSEYLSRRSLQDPDIWVLEVDIADAERFVAQLPR